MEQIDITPAQLLALQAALEKRQKVSKDSVNYRRAQNCGNCSMFRSADANGEGDHGTCTLVQGEIHRYDVCDKWNAGDTYANKPYAGKSAETPIVSTVHHPLGHEGLWHTPSKKVPEMQQLPAYFQNTARALMRDQGMGEQQAIATAVNAVKEWAAGRAFGGKVKVTPQVRQAAKRALKEWEKLKASHH